MTCGNLHWSFEVVCFSLHNEEILFVKTKELLAVLNLGMIHWPNFCAYFMLGTRETCSKTGQPRELNKHPEKWVRWEQLDGHEKKRRIMNTAWGMKFLVSHMTQLHWPFILTLPDFKHQSFDISCHSGLSKAQRSIKILVFPTAGVCVKLAVT